jgi:hypothetical protein
MCVEASAAAVRRSSEGRIIVGGWSRSKVELRGAPVAICLLAGQCSFSTGTTPHLLSMYERDLQDLIRGLRSDVAKKNESNFIAQVIDEIRRGIVSKDMDVKAPAVLKLVYLLDTWLRNVLGLIPCRRSHVIHSIPSQVQRLSRRRSVIRPEYRCSHAHNQSTQEGIRPHH